MLITDAPVAFDSSLPMYVPALPNPSTNRWVADTLTDGAVATWPPVEGNIVEARPTSTQQPVAGLVDGLRGVTFDGVNDGLFATPSVPLAAKHTAYIVVKLTALSGGSTRVLFEIGSAYFVGLGIAEKFQIIGSSGSVTAPSVAITNKWMVVATAVDKTPAVGSHVGRIVTSVDLTATSASNLTLGTGANGNVNFGNVNAANAPAMVLRDVLIADGVMHTEAQMQANIAALKAEYGIA